MDDDTRACEKIEKLAIQLAQAACNASSSQEEAVRLMELGLRIAVLTYHSRVSSPAFRRRIAGIAQRAGEIRVAEQKTTLIEQLEKLGIDPGPIFADRAPGGD